MKFFCSAFDSYTTALPACIFESIMSTSCVVFVPDIEILQYKYLLRRLPVCLRSEKPRVCGVLTVNLYFTITQLPCRSPRGTIFNGAPPFLISFCSNSFTA